MRLFAGTSGFSYKEWKGPFYPDKLANSLMLRYYAERLRAVEINNTFYRMPRSEVMERWAAEVTEGFRFVIKAPRRITHHARLKDTREMLGYLWSSVSRLGSHLGPILFQLPPYLRKDLALLREFLATLPEGLRAVLQLQHASWHDEEVLEVLRDHRACLCFADKDEGDDPRLVATADWGYLRLRRAGYDLAELETWSERIAGQPWKEVYVFFKHEEAGAGPKMAMDFASVFGAA